MNEFDEKTIKDNSENNDSENTKENLDLEDEEELEDEESLKLDNEYKDQKVDHVLPTKIVNEMETSFLSYAMSVIVARALPDVRDGLKPVHRRILHAMNDLGVSNDKPHKKSARIVGDVIGKYHPHGDTAVYEAMVRMAQDFSYRCPLVDGHGNFGSVDGDSAAAMRYTEARMSKVANELLRDINKNTVDFIDNYDGTETEPSVLPARFPNLLVNGASGIAVGMATNIPTHNLEEVINGTLALIDNPGITTDELMTYIPGPDFPTGATIVGASGIKRAYETGCGTIIVRGVAKITTLQNKKQEIIISEIPYQVNKAKLIERIAELAKEKIIEGITELRDESNRKGMKIVIELKKEVNALVILNNLYKYTPLQSSFSVNMIALDHGQPKTLSLKDVLSAYIEHQIEVVTRRTVYDLNKAKARMHILEGLLIALANIDEVVETIKSSQNGEEAVEKLISRFVLSEIQAKAILDMKLQRLTGLEIGKLRSEKEQLEETIAFLNSVLESHDKLMEIIKTELIEIKDKYKDPRRTNFDLTVDTNVLDEDLIDEEDVIITITNKGYIKRLSADTYRTQKRGGKGITATKMQEDDFVERMIFSSTHDNILFFTNFGKVYVLKAFEIPVGSRIAKGLPLVNLLKLDANEKLAAVINVKTLNDDYNLIFGTKKGIIKKTILNQYVNIRSTGIKAIKLAEGDELIAVEKTIGDQNIIFGASNGKAVRFNENEVRQTGRTAAGVRGIQVEDDEQAIGLAVVNSEDDEIIVITEKGYGKRTNVDSFRLKGRNGKGVKFLNITSKSGKPVCLQKSNKDEDIIVVTDKGMIVRTPIDKISLYGRDTQGIRIISLNEGHSVATLTVVPKSEEDIDDEVLEEIAE